MTKTDVTASTVRDYFRADESRMARLSAEAQKTVAAGARGRLHPQAIKAFNSKRRADRRYVLGATKAVKVAKVAQRDSLVKAGVPVGKRGPLSKAALAVLKG